VLGAGVVGLTTAYELSRKGYKVTVVERRDDVAQAASYANAGTLNAKMRELMASPDNLKRALLHFLGRDSRAIGQEAHREFLTDVAEQGVEVAAGAAASAAASNHNAADPERAASSPPDAKPGDKAASRRAPGKGHAHELGFLDLATAKAEEWQHTASEAAEAVKHTASEAAEAVKHTASEAAEAAAERLEALQKFLTEFKVLTVSPAILARFDFWRWGANFGLMCLMGYKERRNAADRLVERSLCALQETAEREGHIEFDLRRCGSVRVFLDEEQFEREAAEVHASPEEGVEVLTKEEAVRREPSLGTLSFAGAIYNSEDQLGDCFKFCSQLADRCRANGVIFRTSTLARSVITKDGRAVGVCLEPVRHKTPRAGSTGGSPTTPDGQGVLPVLGQTDEESALVDEPREDGGAVVYAATPGVSPRSVSGQAEPTTVQEVLPCDALVVSCGVESARLLPGLSSRVPWLPIVPVRGYSLTGLASPRPEDCPHSYILIEEPLHAIVSRFGDRVRITSHAELSMALEPEPARTRDLWHAADLFFPRAFLRREEVEAWMGRRPMTSDSLPIVGIGPLPNVILNTGHGAHGWRLSHGTARIVADILSGAGPRAIDVLSPRRFPLL
jgi:glycine/D-amino acid oxidase-like deaminating enzyme